MHINMTLEELVGQQLMIGISGNKVTPEAIKLFQDTHAGGLIVFRPNFESAAAFKKLILDLEAAIGRRLLIAVDHEGGRVIHLTEGITVFPDNLALGQTKNENYAKQQGEIEAKELRRLFIDVNLSPTLDVLTENFSPNIGIRSYGKDPDLVARFGSARIKAMQANGLSACAKHFPGQGQSSIDAHLGLPVLETNWDELKKIHLKPFIEAIRSGVDSVMSSHPVYPNLDPSKVPATFSKRIIHDFLRNELGFQGVIFTDDLEMGALRNLCSIGESAVKSIAAGHDMVLVCHDPDSIREVYTALLEAYRKKDLKQSDLEQSIQRINKLKKVRQNNDVFPEPAGRRIAQSISREAIQPLGEMSAPLSVIFPKLSSLSDRIYIEKEMLDEQSYVKSLFGHKVKQILIVGIDPTDSEIEKAQAIAGEGAHLVFFCYDAHLYPQTQKLLELVQTKARKCSIVLLRDPYDRRFIKKDIPATEVYGFRSVQIRAAIEHFPSKCVTN